MLLLTLAMGCLVESKSPFLGECAQAPEGYYNYGDVGIGSCIAGPTSLQWLDDSTLLVTNANPFLDYLGGSVITVDVDAVLQDAGKHVDKRVSIVPGLHVTSEFGVETVLDDGTLSQASLPGYSVLVPGAAGEDGLLLVPNRLTPEARGRAGFDRIHMVSVGASGGLAAAPVADGSDTLELMSDPTVSAYDPQSELVFIGNLTSHTVSVLDVSEGQVSLIDANPRATVSTPSTQSTSGTGEAEISLLRVLEPELVSDQSWTLAYVDGNTRLWLPGELGLTRLDSAGAEQWRESGIELQVGDGLGGFVELQDPMFGISSLGSLHQYMEIDDALFVAVPSSNAAEDWGVLGNSALNPRSDNWDAALGGPMPVVSAGVDYLFFDGMNEQTGESGIGLASSSDAERYTREQSGPVLVAGAGGEHDSVRVADPYVVYDWQADRWRMFYSAWDGAVWSIGHATSADLKSWTADEQPVFELPGGVASPVILANGDGFVMWSARPSDDGWVLGLATSADGSRWTDQGVSLQLETGSDPMEPPGASVQYTETRGWSVQGDQDGNQEILLRSGDLGGFGGLVIQISSGYSVGVQGMNAAEGGLRADSYLGERLMLSVVDEQGVERIARTDSQDRIHVSFQASDSELATQGVHSPVVFESAEGLSMLYAAVDSEDLSRIGRAVSSDDGVTWQDQGLALELGQDWDSVRVIPGAVVGDGEDLLLYYTGFNGAKSRIGTAASTDGGLSWTRVEGAENPWIYEGGAPGDFDDSAVRAPYVLRQDGVDHIWYGGHDGSTWRIGYASREVGSEQWKQPENRDGGTKWASVGNPGTYGSMSVDRAIARFEDDGSVSAYISGWDAPELTSRVGRASGLSPQTLYPQIQAPVLGDTIPVFTQGGDDGDSMAISLEVQAGGGYFSGVANSYMHVDEQRGFLYIGSEQLNAIYVVDIRDDSTESFQDSNVFRVEALLIGNTDSGSSSTRGLLAPPGSRWLYGLNSAPDSLVVYDADAIVDDAQTDVYFDAPVGSIALPRGILGDEGLLTRRDVGPAQVVLAGDMLVVANFNDNSLSYVDTRLGAYGQVVSDLDWVGENPHALALSPDGKVLAVGNYLGQIVNGHVSSSVALVDMDPGSPTYLQVLATVVNQ